MDPTIVIIGGDEATGEMLATRIAGDSLDVMFLGEDDRAVERATAAGIDARIADPSEPATLDDEGIEDVDTAIVASRRDERNLLIAQLLRLRRAERVIALVNDPTNVEAFAEAGIEPVSASTALADALDRQRRVVERTERSSEQETPNATKQRPEREESTNGPERERVRSDGAGGDG